jgi:large subunit ribosomal protein L23
MTTIYEILRRPIITEKSNYLAGDLNQYVFEIALNANKNQVKEAVETLFDVNVLKVNILKVAPKRNRRWKNRRVLVRRGGYKKAIVTLAPGNRIEAFEGVR